LWPQAGQLREAMQILKGGGEALEVAVFEEAPDANLDAGAVAQRLMAVAARTQRWSNCILVAILLDQAIDIGVRHFIHVADQIADAVAVDAVAQPHLGADL